jgi:(S)-mandelate dehydrogenase
MNNPETIAGFRAQAQRNLPREIFDYIEGGADDEICIQTNRRALDEIKLVPRRLTGIPLTRNRHDKSPFLVAPLGLCGTVWPRGDIAIARAAMQENVPYILSTVSNASIEDIARASDGDRWFQLYVVTKEVSFDLIRRAASSDYSTLVITTDVPVNGNRERDIANKFQPANMTWQKKFRLAIEKPLWATRIARGPRIDLANFADEHDDKVVRRLLKRSLDTTLSWDDIRQFRDAWPGKLYLKGLLHRDDILMDCSLGADGVVISNHGGRQLDASISSIDSLKQVDVARNISLLVDSGFRRGSDAIKAKALGADGILLGRPILYGLATSGESGVRAVLKNFRASLDNTLTQIGCNHIAQVTRDHVWMSSSPSDHIFPAIREMEP